MHPQLRTDSFESMLQDVGAPPVLLHIKHPVGRIRRLASPVDVLYSLGECMV